MAVFVNGAFDRRLVNVGAVFEEGDENATGLTTFSVRQCDSALNIIIRGL